MREWALKKHRDMRNAYGDKYPKNIFAFIPNSVLIIPWSHKELSY